MKLTEKKEPPGVSINLAADRMTAMLIILPGKTEADKTEDSGEPLPPAVTPEIIRDALRDAGVRFGVDDALLETIAENPHPGEYVIARGRAPEAGQNGSIVCHFTENKHLQPKQLPDGRVDYHHLGLIQNVHKGEMLCTALPPTQGVPGMDVTGTEIKQVAGHPAELREGENTHMDAGQTMLISDIDGEVSQSGGRVNVYPTYTVAENVGVSTGDVEFLGNVHVCGSIREGMRVEAGGNVEVDGMVDGGSITAKGSIVVHQGCIGHDGSKFECGGDFVGNFIENCSIHAGGNVTIASLMYCTVVCGKTLELVGQKAKIIGGSCRAGQNILAGIVGSASSVHTELTLGVDPAVVEHGKALEQEIAALQAQQSKLKNIVDMMRTPAGKALSRKKEGLSENVSSSLKKTEKELHEKTYERDELNRKMDEVSKGRIVARGTMHRGTRLTIGFACAKVENDCPEVVYRMDKGRVSAFPLNDTPPDDSTGKRKKDVL